jgi:hypothetical protein
MKSLDAIVSGCGFKPELAQEVRLSARNFIIDGEPDVALDQVVFQRDEPFALKIPVRHRRINMILDSIESKPSWFGLVVGEWYRDSVERRYCLYPKLSRSLGIARRNQEEILLPADPNDTTVVVQGEFFRFTTAGDGVIYSFVALGYRDPFTAIHAGINYGKPDQPEDYVAWRESFDAQLRGTLTALQDAETGPNGFYYKQAHRLAVRFT